MVEYLISETTQRVCNILDEISQPAAPYYESRVACAIQTLLSPFCDHPHVRLFFDRYGNLAVTYRHPDARFDASLAAAAHMDHPGYHVLSVDTRTATMSIMGGLPRDKRLIGSAALIYRKNYENRGTVTGFTNEEKTGVLLDLDRPWKGPSDFVWGVPDVERFRLDGNLIHGRAMDDLVGCAQQIAAFEIMIREEIPVEFTAIFNRAEEVGFLGAVGACELGTIPIRSVVLSLEASKHLDGAQPGHGIILRTGDRQAMFDASVTDLLERAAEAALEKQVRHQKRRMDGGTCEATLYMAYGYETGALAVPLINYHNHGDTSVEAEAIHRDDLAGGVVMLVEMACCLANSERLPRALFREHMKARFYSASKTLMAAGENQ